MDLNNIILRHGDWTISIAQHKEGNRVTDQEVAFWKNDGGDQMFIATFNDSLTNLRDVLNTVIADIDHHNLNGELRP